MATRNCKEGESFAIRNHKYLGTVRWRLGGYIHGLAFSPDGKALCSGSSDSTALVWDVRGK
jgi:WD40 repeat protein